MFVDKKYVRSVMCVKKNLIHKRTFAQKQTASES